MSDDDDDEEGVDAGVPGKTRNRSGNSLTELKNIILVIAWSECSSAATTDNKGLSDLMYQKILNWLDLFATDYGNIMLNYVKDIPGTSTIKLKSDKIIADLRIIFKDSGDYVRLAKKVVADINKYLTPYWNDPSDAAKVRFYFS